MRDINWLNRRNGVAFRLSGAMQQVHALDPDVPLQTVPFDKQLQAAAMLLLSHHVSNVGAVASSAVSRLESQIRELRSWESSARTAVRWGVALLILGIAIAVLAAFEVIVGPMDRTMVIGYCCGWDLGWVVFTIAALMRKDLFGDRAKELEQELEKLSNSFKGGDEKVHGDLQLMSLFALMEDLGFRSGDWYIYVGSGQKFFVETAGNVLVGLAKRVLLAQRPDLRRRGYTQEDHVDLRRRFVALFVQCNERGLVGDDHTPIYDEAKKQLIEERDRK